MKRDIPEVSYGDIVVRETIVDKGFKVIVMLHPFCKGITQDDDPCARVRVKIYFMIALPATQDHAEAKEHERVKS